MSTGSNNLAYDAADRLQKVTDGLGGEHEMVHDAEGDLVGFSGENLCAATSPLLIAED